MWLALLMAATAIVLLVRVRRPLPEPMPVGGVTDSLADGASARPSHPAEWRRQRYRRTTQRPTWERTAPSDAAVAAAPQRRPVVVDLNEADTLTLQMLYGIGPTFARRIVRYRERLGGYYSVEQLREVYGMTDDRYQGLLPHVTVTTDSLRYIDINKVTIKELMRHPYVDAYQARDIIRWRDKGHAYRTVDDLRLVATMDDTTLARLAPYLSFE